MRTLLKSVQKTILITPLEPLQIIYINSDGSITPQTAKIRHDGDKYTFSDNVHDPIGILRDNAIIDSAGYTHQGP